MTLDQIIDTSVELESNYIEYEDCEKDLLIQLNNSNLDVIDVMTEANTLIDAIEIQTEGIKVRVDPKIKVNFIEKIKKFVREIFQKIVDFFTNIGRAIYTYFHEKIVVERSARLSRHLDLLKDFYNTGNYEGITGNITVNTIEFQKGLNFGVVIEALNVVNKYFEPLVQNIEDYAKKINEMKNTPSMLGEIIRGDPLSSWFPFIHTKYEKCRNELFKALIPDQNPDLIQNSEVRKAIRARFFGEKLTRTEQNIKDVIPDYKVFSESLDKQLYQNYKSLVDKSSRRIRDVNRTMNELIDRIDKAEDPTSAYTQASGILNGYTKLLNLLLTCISVHWELFLTIRGEIIRIGLIAVNKLASNNVESTEVRYELLK